MKETRLSFEDQIQKNKLKSLGLIVIIFIFFLILGWIIALILDPSYFFIIMIFSTIFSIGYILVSFYNSDKIALASVNAKPASQTHHRELFHAAENMSLASGLPMPRLFVMESDEINAFASGRDPEHAVMCFTTGALNKLEKQELEGVVAHEMAHIANYDIRFMTLTAVMVGMISIIAQIFLRSLWFSNVSDGRGNRDGRLQLFLIILGVLFAILAPLVANLVSLAISRKREFTADATGVKFTRYPRGLASALKKIKHEHVSDRDKKHYAKAVAPLFISDPFKKKVQGLFSTHPPIDERISRLERM
jgi:heat shock protein HtpX